MQQILFRHPSYLAPISYVGSKKKLFKTLSLYVLNEVPTEMVSPFAGGCSLELRFAAEGTRVYTYDIFPPFVEFYQLFNGRSDEIIAKVLEIYPLPKETYEHMRLGGGWEALECPIHRAAITWSINKQCFMGRNFSSVQVSDKNIISIGVFSQPEWVGWKNDNITFEVADYRDALARHPNILAYMDPPYLGKEDFYGKGDQGEFDHEELRDLLRKRDNWILSYGDDEKGVIRGLYEGYKIYRPTWGYGYGKAAGVPEKSAELLILSPDVEERRKSNVRVTRH